MTATLSSANRAELSQASECAGTAGSDKTASAKTVKINKSRRSIGQAFRGPEKRGRRVQHDTSGDTRNEIYRSRQAAGPSGQETGKSAPPEPGPSPGATERPCSGMSKGLPERGAMV